MGSSGAMKVGDLCIGDQPIRLADRAFQNQLFAILGVDQRATAEDLRGCGGAHNEGVCILKTPTEELVLKLVRNQAIFPGVPTEAENLIKISREHPSILQDSSVAFPRQIVRLLGSRQEHRYDVIVMQKAVGQGLGQVIQQKWRAGRIPELMSILEKVGECLGKFHQRYGNKQHGDLTPTNVLYDETSGCVTLIDLGGMGCSSCEGDVNYFSKNLSLSARLVGQQLETQGVQHFKQGYAKAAGGNSAINDVHSRCATPRCPTPRCATQRPATPAFPHPPVLRMISAPASQKVTTPKVHGPTVRTGRTMAVPTPRAYTPYPTLLTSRYY